MKKYLTIIFILFIWIYSVNSQWISSINNKGQENNTVLNSKGLVVTTDKNGNCYVAGISYIDSNSTNIITIRYNQQGDTLWSRTYFSQGNGVDKAFGIVTDGEDNIIIIGTTYITGLSYEMLVLKYDPLGNLLWTRTLGGSDQNLEDKAFGIVTDDLDNIIICGYTTSIDNIKRLTLVKYSKNGRLLWNVSDNNSGFSESFAKKVMIDYNGNILTTGNYFNNNNWNILTKKYNSQGSLIWQKIFDGSSSLDDVSNDMIVDNDNNIIVTGYETKSNLNSNTDYLILKYSPDGNLLWMDSEDGGNSLKDIAVGLEINDRNDVIISGYCTRLSSGCDYLTIKYNETGFIGWKAYYNGINNEDDIVYDIDIKINNSNIYVTGSSIGTSSDFDFLTVKYSRTGQEIKTYRFSQNEANDVATDIDVSSSNKIYITGYSILKVYPSLSSLNTIMLQDEENNIGINSDNNNINEFNLHQNFPNPFNPYTILSFYIPFRTNVEINIYDASGKIINNFLNNTMNSGEHEMVFYGDKLSSGIYFYEIVTPGYREVKKMILIK